MAFKAAGIYGGLRAEGEKPDLALAVCDAGAASAGALTTNVVAAVPVVYCKKALYVSKTVCGNSILDYLTIIREREMNFLQVTDLGAAKLGGVI